MYQICMFYLLATLSGSRLLVTHCVHHSAGNRTNGRCSRFRVVAHGVSRRGAAAVGFQRKWAGFGRAVRQRHCLVGCVIKQLQRHAGCAVSAGVIQVAVGSYRAHCRENGLKAFCGFAKVCSLSLRW
nr:MAG TPA: hypothetical protein [Caudoviricetes sp.]